MHTYMYLLTLKTNTRISNLIVVRSQRFLAETTSHALTGMFVIKRHIKAVRHQTQK